MKKKISLLLCIMMVCALLVGCGAENAAQGERDTEQSTQTQAIVENQTGDEIVDGDKSDDGYPRGGLITEQTFDLNLEPIGEVTFASYLPDDSENPLADVVFLIEKDGEILSQLPGVSENNVNTEMFHQVEAVNFSDYNYDGCDDIILIISYYLGAGPQAATPHSTVRYYAGSETGEFTYEKQMSEDATSALAEITINSAKGFIGYEGPKQSKTQEDVEESDMNPLYEAFLKNEISVANPYAQGDVLSVMTDEDYESEFDGAQKNYAFADVNGDEQEELIFKISAYPSELMMILGVYDDELICFDVMETHTRSMAFGVYDYGMVWWSQNYDGFETIFYTYTADGQPNQARRFTEGDEADIAAHEGEEPEWFDWNDFVNIGILLDI